MRIKATGTPQGLTTARLQLIKGLVIVKRQNRYILTCVFFLMNVTWFSLMRRAHMSTKTRGAENCKEFLLRQPTKRS